MYWERKEAKCARLVCDDVSFRMVLLSFSHWLKSICLNSLAVFLRYKIFVQFIFSLLPHFFASYHFSLILFALLVRFPSHSSYAVVVVRLFNISHRAVHLYFYLRNCVSSRLYFDLILCVRFLLSECNVFLFVSLSLLLLFHSFRLPLLLLPIRSFMGYIWLSLIANTYEYASSQILYTAE